MGDASALHAALAMTDTPAFVRVARRSPLPSGMTLLLEIAAGDSSALGSASQTTGQSEEMLRGAAGFFIEQILLTQNADSYRVLGAYSGTPGSELRRHMALLLKWLHPDVAAQRGSSAGIDRSVFANRVITAWENLKTEDRRATYDELLSKDRAIQKRRLSGRARKKKQRHTSSHKGTRLTQPKMRQRSPKRLEIFPLKREPLVSRLLRFLRGRR